MSMSYGYETTKYGLRAPQLGDNLDPDEERRNADILDNSLYGAIRCHSGGHGIIRSPKLQLVYNTDTSDYTVIGYESKSTGNQLEGFINQIYVNVVDALRWEGLSNSTFYYLYVRLVETATESSLVNKEVITESNTTGIVPSDGILLGAVYISEPGNSIVYTDPVGKIKIPTWGDHVVDNENPHTPFLNQDELTVSGLEVLNYLRYRNLEIDQLIVSGNQIISGDITVLGRLIVSGGVVVHGNITYQNLLVQNITVPGVATVANLVVASGMDVYGNAVFRRNVQLSSGITIDGFDPSEARPLITGVNADHLHTHTMGSLAYGTKTVFQSPEYSSTVLSGDSSGPFSTISLYGNHYYQYFTPGTNGVAKILVTKFFLPPDFSRIDRIRISQGVGNAASGNHVQVTVYDKDNTQVLINENNNLGTLQIGSTDLTISGGQFAPKTSFSVVNRMVGFSGIMTLLGDMTLFYVPVHGEKLTYNWVKSVSGNSVLAPVANFDGLRVAPADLRVEKVIVSQSLALSGATVVDIGVSNAGSAPVGVLSTKPTISHGSTGSSFAKNELVPATPITISQGQIIGSTIDLIASGSKDVSVELITYRI